MNDLLSVKNLSVAYGENTTVRNVSLRLAEGAIRCLVGTTGSGKSTVLHAVAGLLGAGARITGGSIVFCGEELSDATPSRMRELLGNRIALIFQNPENFFDPIMRIGDQFAEFLKYHDSSLQNAECADMTVKALAEMRLEEPERLLSLYPFELSGGMLQRCAIALAMLSKPRLLLADEPTSALDIVSQAKILGELKRLNRETGTAILLVTHSMKVATALDGLVSVMHDGEVVEEGFARDVLSQPKAAYTKELIHSLPDIEEMRLVE